MPSPLTCGLGSHRNPRERSVPVLVPVIPLLRFGQSDRLSWVCPEVLVHLLSSGSQPTSPAAAYSSQNSSGSTIYTSGPCILRGTCPGLPHPRLRLPGS